MVLGIHRNTFGISQSRLLPISGVGYIKIRNFRTWLITGINSSNMTSRTSNSQPPDETRLTQSENAARAAFEAVASRALTDLEWARWRVGLSEFIAILLEWDRQTDTSAPRTDNVVMLWEPAQTSDCRLEKAA
jgi:hypothetical protein